MLPIVFIDVPEEVPPGLAATAVRACDATLGPGRCRLNTDKERSSTKDGAWIATIVGSEALGSFRIELGNTQPLQVQIRFSRTLEFDASEPDLRRWSAVGVVVAALVIDASASSVNARKPDTPESVPESGDASATSAVRDPSRAASAPPAPAHSFPAAPTKTKSATALQSHGKEVRLAVQAAYTRTANSTERVGMHATPSVTLSGFALGWAGVGVSVSSRSVLTRAWSGALGIGFASAPLGSGLGVEGRIGVGAELLTFHVERGNQTDQATRWRYGLVAGIDLILELTRSLDLVASLSGSVLSPTVRVNVTGDPVDQLGLLQGLAAIGLRVRFGL